MIPLAATTTPNPLHHVLTDIVRFTHHFGGLDLRTYQAAPARAILDSVLHKRGLSFVVMFPRQSGKNELQAQLEVFLLLLFSERSAEMVKISPTHQPQSLNAMRRLERALQSNLLTRDRWRVRAGNLYQFRNAHLTFLSGAPESHIVGATASMLLEVDEAQDVSIAKYDKEIAPMAASTNATRVFWGTAWTSHTLLARELRAARDAQNLDNIQRVFVTSADEVGREVPAYRAFVQEQVSRLGRTHPLVRTQFFSEEVDAEGGLFTPQRIALVRGTHPLQSAPLPNARYAILVALAGEDEALRSAGQEDLANPARDATALTIIEVDLDLLCDELIRKPTYRVVSRHLWTGEKHAEQYRRIRALAEAWRAQHIIVDASGVGAGLASFLRDSLGDRLIPVVFNAAVKSRVGWGFLAVIDSGRFKDHACEGENEQTRLQNLFLRQLEGVQYAIGSGPEKQLRWGVPPDARDHTTGELLHDDLVLSAALVSILDERSWAHNRDNLVVPALDPLKEIDQGG